MPKSYTQANAVLNHFLRNTVQVPVATVYAGLFTTAPSNPGDVGVEVSGGSYARQAITFDLPVDGLSSNSGEVSFPMATAPWGVVLAVGLFDALTGGNLLYYGDFSTFRLVDTNDSAYLSAGTFQITEVGFSVMFSQPASSVGLGVTTNVIAISSQASDAGTLTIGVEAPANMVVVPRTGLRIAIMGQSNAVGGGIDVGRPPISGVFYDEVVFGDPAIWPAGGIERLGETAVSVRPLNGAHGVEFGIVLALQAAGYGITSVCKYAVSGSSMSSLAASACWQADQNELYLGAKDWVLDRQVEYGEPIDILVWHQGESDAQVLERVQAYDVNLHNFCTQLRTDLGNPNLIVVVPRLNIVADVAFPGTLRTQQELWQARAPHINRVIDIDSVAMNPADNVHYLSAGHDLVGSLLAARLATRSLELSWTPNALNPSLDLVVSATLGNITRSAIRTVNVYDPAVAPDDIANLELWFDGTVGMTTSGDPLVVTSWLDQASGVSLAQGTGTAQPLAAVGGGYTGDSNDVLISSGLVLSQYRWIHSEATIFLVLRRLDSIDSRYFFNTCSNGLDTVGVSMYGASLGRFSGRVLNGSGVASYNLGSSAEAFPQDIDFHVLVLTFDSTSGQLRADGLEVATSAIGAALATGVNQSSQINAINTASRLSGTYLEQIFYSRKLSVPEIQSIETYLLTKWQPSNIVTIDSLPSAMYIGVPETILVTCTPEDAVVTLTVNGELFGTLTEAVAGECLITGVPTIVMLGSAVDVVASISGATDTQNTDVVDVEVVATLSLDLDPSQGAYLDTGRVEHLRNWAADLIIDPDVNGWLEQNVVAAGADPYTITETVTASVLHAAYKNGLVGSGVGVLEAVSAKRNVGTRNIRVRAGTVQLVDFDLGSGIVITETGATGTIGIADVDGYYPLTIASVPDNTFMYLNLLSGSSATYAGDGTSSVLVRDVRREYTAWQGSDGSQPNTDGTSISLAVDDFLTTQVAPSAVAGTMWGWVQRSNIGVDLRSVMGAEVGTAFCALGVDVNHYPIAQIGTEDATVIKGVDGDDIPIDWVFLAVTWDSFNVSLYHGDGQTLTLCYDSAQVGVVPTTQPVYVGAVNDDGVADTFWTGLIARHGMGTVALTETDLRALAYITRPTLSAPVLTLPATLTLVAGVPFVVRDANLILRGSISVTSTCPYTHNAGVLTLSPVSPGTYELTVTVTTAGGTDIAVVLLNVVAASIPTLNLLVIGDSITATGYYVDSLVNDGAAVNISLLGLTTTTVGSHPVEGHGGWGFSEYRDGVTSPMAPSGVIDIASYMTALGATPDVIVWALGTNDVFGIGPGSTLEAAIDASFEDFDQLKAAWDVVDPMILHVFALPAPGNSRQSAFDLNYSGANQDRWKFRAGVHRWNERALASYDGTDVVVVPLGLSIDQVGGYPFDNAVHPDAIGGSEMAPALLAYLQSI